MAAAALRRPGPALPLLGGRGERERPWHPPEGLSGETRGKTYEKRRDDRGKSLFFTPEDCSSSGNGLCEGLRASVQPFPSQQFSRLWWTSNSLFFQGETGFPQDNSVSLWKAQWWLPRARSGKSWPAYKRAPGKGLWPVPEPLGTCVCRTALFQVTSILHSQPFKILLK